MAIKSVNPVTGQLLHEYETFNQSAMSTMIDDMETARDAWAASSLAERQLHCEKLIRLFQERVPTYAEICVETMGKPYQQAMREVQKCVTLCEYYQQHVGAWLQEETVQMSVGKGLICYQPLGIIFAIVPWNFPFWQAMRCLIPNVLAGNTVLLKHAPNTTRVALELEKLFLEAGFPEGVVRSVVVEDETVESIIAHKHVAGVSFTGSTRVGAIIAEMAGRHLKKVVCELGGSDPMLVLADADVDLAVQLCVQARLTNAGQICISSKRILVHESLMDQFIEGIMAALKQQQIGDPMREETTMGPLAREDLRQHVHAQVQASINEGACCMWGGELPEGDGFFYPPTLLVDVKPGITVFDEECFGPVIAVTSVQTEAEAIRLANHSPYGLGAIIVSRDEARAREIAKQSLTVGMVGVNAVLTSDPSLPFGGVKQSGIGRELGKHGLLEFVNIKTLQLA